MRDRESWTEQIEERLVDRRKGWKLRGQLNNHHHMIIDIVATVDVIFIFLIIIMENIPIK